MRSTLFVIPSLSIWHALIVALVLAGVAVLLIWREKRLGRIEPGEYGKSLAAGVGLALGICVVFFLVTRFAHPIQVRSYGVMLMLAFAAGIGIAVARAPLYRIEPLNVIDLSLFILFGSILGSRVVYIALNWSTEYAQDPMSVLNVWEGGLAFHGGLIGGTLGGWVFCLRRKIRPTFVIDLVAPSVAFGYALARIGCFLNGCCAGGPTKLPWGVDFVHDSVQGPVHPTQLYSGLGHILVGLALLWLAPRIRVPGQLGPWFLAMSSVVRTFDEVFRRDYSAQVWGWLPALTQAQAVSVALIILSVALLMWSRKRVGYPLGPAEDSSTAEPPKDRKQPRGKKARKAQKG
ncbi:MAG: prolipoprotein diacylglyceryl transferase [Armatimonadetes bacterium]|nr:prolipoprotein diacylglyceryl transferase [Armatimonadota bacterium]